MQALKYIVLKYLSYGMLLTTFLVQLAGTWIWARCPRFDSPLSLLWHFKILAQVWFDQVSDVAGYYPSSYLSFQY